MSELLYAPPAVTSSSSTPLSIPNEEEKKTSPTSAGKKRGIAEVDPDMDAKLDLLTTQIDRLKRQRTEIKQKSAAAQYIDSLKQSPSRSLLGLTAHPVTLGLAAYPNCTRRYSTYSILFHILSKTHLSVFDDFSILPKSLKWKLDALHRPQIIDRSGLVAKIVDIDTFLHDQRTALIFAQMNSFKKTTPLTSNEWPLSVKSRGVSLVPLEWDNKRKCTIGSLEIRIDQICLRDAEVIVVH